MATTQQQASGGIGFFTLLGVILIFLKLTGTINWSWWWVLAPFYAPALFFIAIFVIVFIIATIVVTVRKASKK